MRPSSLIGHVIEVYAKFSKNPARPADNVIRHFFLTRKYLGAKDRRFIADAFFGTVKNWRRLEALAEDAFPRDGGEPLPALTVAAYFIAISEQSPRDIDRAYAEMEVKHGFPSEVFWTLADRNREIMRLALLPPIERIAIAYSYPLWFVKRVHEEYGEESEDILGALNDEAPTVLRANKLVVESREVLKHELENEGCPTTLSLLAEDALVLPQRVNVMSMETFKRGMFEIQDEASQLVAPFAHIEKKAPKVLDACAGAGGKTLHLAALLKNAGEIFATDVDGRKLEELKRRVRRSNAQNVRIVGPDKKDRILDAKSKWFDVVLLDVPCSGTGTLRRNPGIKWILTEQMLSELLAKQADILETHFDYVKPGGRLLYATCALLKEEGEDQIARFIQAHPDFELEETLRTRPDKDGCDGFFAARMRRKATETANS